MAVECSALNGIPRLYFPSRKAEETHWKVGGKTVEKVPVGHDRDMVTMKAEPPWLLQKINPVNSASWNRKIPMRPCL